MVLGKYKTAADTADAEHKTWHIILPYFLSTYIVVH